ncbi:MAG: beta-galactosidase [Opitutaceae bacterium]|nr:beta-galactosidase [Opitutaceae bacterium]
MRRLAPLVSLVLWCIAVGHLGLARVEAAQVFDMAEAQWRARVFPIAPLTAAQSCTFASGQDAAVGAWLSVGPWVSGMYTSRYEYRTAVPPAGGVLRGWFRTENLPAGYALVYLRYRYADGSTADRTLALGSAVQWQRFELPVRTVPPGAPTDLTIALGLGALTQGRLLFAGVEWAELPTEAEWFPPMAGPLVRGRPLPSTPAPRYRVEWQQGTAWLIAPDGRPWYLRSVDAPSFKSIEAGRAVVGQAHAAGFNAFGGWPGDLYWLTRTNNALVAEGAAPMPLVLALSYESLSNVDWMIHPTEGGGGAGHEFPDVYDPDFEPAFRAIVSSRLAMTGGASWFVGWFVGNELTFRDLHRRLASPACWGAYVVFLRMRYGDSIAALNAAWGAALADFGALTPELADPLARAGAKYEDAAAFKRVTVQRFYTRTAAIIRELDPGRLVFSPRFNDFGHFQEAEADLLAAAFDAVAVNVYPQNCEGGLAPAERDYFAAVAATGLPVLIGEWSVPAWDSGYYDGGHPLDFSWARTVLSQAERAWQAARLQLQFYNLPFVIGADWFKWHDIEGAGNRWANRGLCRADGTPWAELQLALGEVGAAIDAAESGAIYGCYRRWATALVGTGDDPAADRDGDGRSDLLEYAQNTDPLAADQASG